MYTNNNSNNDNKKERGNRSPYAKKDGGATFEVKSGPRTSRLQSGVDGRCDLRAFQQQSQKQFEIDANL